ncbi:helix-turn-helix domain-containing protein [Lacrimispora sphenoides]|jgi:transcriptional regulator with XRE-family HTH domain|uniref:DNA-binding transcriptional regulator, XRE-family HTH domain n=1 Tax=Lacrimispora sphenoides JCM 1415 TaxID=1297793 RepID=A0ABY1C256_9FIRM|nr:helix-turn-helix transcriptional regulator [Lacrimispora sphenoides]SET55680.1 DNA-binding transcriptional regulator, XRE-family HTH domain [[Clostridium] sphenoides JCM 1415]SUY49737.1 XRE family transcriptional regulator [Lacrimispora sphenoides]
MDADYIRKKITELRIKKDVSEHRMSLDLGHSRSYIHGIVTGKSLPSMTEFLYICEYLEVTPKYFFDSDGENPILISQLVEEASSLSESDLLALVYLAKRLKK